MKLKYLFLAMLATAGFISCSNEDDKVDPNATYDAALTVSVAPSAETATKASTENGTDDGSTDEQKVNTLTAFVFNESGNLVAVKDTTNAKEIKNIVVKATTAGTPYQLFLVANLHNTALKSVTSLSSLKSSVASLTDEVESSLTMTSQVLNITVKGVEGERVCQNYVINQTGSIKIDTEGGLNDYTALTSTGMIPITRLASRIQLDKLTVAFVGGNLEGAKFRLDSAYLVNVKSQSLYLGDDLTTGTEYWNATGSFTVKGNLISPLSVSKASPYLVTPKITLTSGNVSSNSVDFTTSANSNNYLKAYAFENHIAEVSGTYNTRLILKGEIILSTGQSLGTSYYHITIAGPDNAYYVVRNTIYKIEVTITGTGSPNEDQKSDLNAGINAKVTVVPWKVVNQTEDDAN